MTTQTHNALLAGYSESNALQQLMRATGRALQESNKLFDAGNYDDTYDQIVINVGGESFAFILGGPQSEAIFDFVQHIADENFYAVDFDTLTVEG